MHNIKPFLQVMVTYCNKTSFNDIVLTCFHHKMFSNTSLFHMTIYHATHVLQHVPPLSMCENAATSPIFLLTRFFSTRFFCGLPARCSIVGARSASISSARPSTSDGDRNIAPNKASMLLVGQSLPVAFNVEP